jgi:hypothetical protein
MSVSIINYKNFKINPVAVKAKDENWGDFENCPGPKVDQELAAANKSQAFGSGGLV